MNTYPLDNLWKKKHYLARLDGPDDTYVVSREFLRGTPRKGRGIVEYQADDIGQVPSWIVRAGGECGGCGRPDPDKLELIAAYGHGWEIVGEGYTSGDLLKVWESGPPGDTPEDQVHDALTVERVPVYAADLEDPF